MKTAEAIELVSFLSAAYGREMSRPTAMAYAAYILDFDRKVAEDVVLEFPANQTFMPSIAELRTAIKNRQLSRPPEDQATRIGRIIATHTDVELESPTNDMIQEHGFSAIQLASMQRRSSKNPTAISEIVRRSLAKIRAASDGVAKRISGPRG